MFVVSDPWNGGYRISAMFCGPLATMPRDLRKALYLLALQLVKKPSGKTKSVRDLVVC